MDIMNPMAPQLIGGGQLYSTESGRLFHAGKICIVLAGLPGRGKTHLSVSLTRYLRWLGVKTHSFHLGNYRRANAEENLNHDLFIPSPDTKKANEFRTKIVDECLNDVIGFFQKEGQVAIYDAVNALPEYRAELYEKFKALNIQVLFIESLVTDDTIIMKNMEEAARSSPDYKNWDYKKAYNDYCERINFLTPYYQEMGENDKDLSYIKFINFGERIELHNSNYGYLINKVVFFLMNSRIKSGSVFFARCYKNSLDYSYDPPLDETGLEYAKNLTNTLISHLKSQGKNYIKDIQLEKRPDPPKRELSIDERQPAAGVDGIDDDSLVIWTSVKQRTIETTQFFAIRNIKIRHRIQLSQKNPGVVGTMSDEEILKTYPEEWKHFVKDLYHYRFSRAESYHDLAIKIEPLILEMERMSGDILIIADESILKVLYGYLMSCSCYDIPGLQFLTDEILEIKYNAYENTAEVIPIQGDNE
jgi:Fructose-2,6-bisphosphatase